MKSKVKLEVGSDIGRPPHVVEWSTRRVHCSATLRRLVGCVEQLQVLWRKGNDERRGTTRSLTSSDYCRAIYELVR